MTETISTTVRNGVDTATMFAALDAIKAQPWLARFPNRASSLSQPVNRAVLRTV